MDGSHGVPVVIRQRHYLSTKRKYPKSYMSGMGIKWRDIENTD